MTLHGRDMTGVIDARLRLDQLESRFSLSLNCTWSRPLLPGAALPVLRFMQHAVPPNTLSFRIGEGDNLMTTPVAAPAGLAVSEDSVRMVEDLERLQVATGEPFPVPREWTVGDQREVHRAVRLLDGQRIKVGNGPVHFVVDDPQPVIEAFESSQMSLLTITPREPYVTHVAGHDLDLGPYRFYIDRAQLDPSSVAPTADGTYQLSVLPGPDCGIEVALGESTAGNGQSPAGPS